MSNDRKQWPCKYYSRGFCHKTSDECPFGHFRIDEKYKDSRSESIDSTRPIFESYYRLSPIRSPSRSPQRRFRSRSPVRRSRSRSKSPKIRFQSTYYTQTRSNSCDSKANRRSETPENRREVFNDLFNSTLPSTSNFQDFSSSSFGSMRSSLNKSPLNRSSSIRSPSIKSPSRRSPSLRSMSIRSPSIRSSRRSPSLRSSPTRSNSPRQGRKIIGRRWSINPKTGYRVNLKIQRKHRMASRLNSKASFDRNNMNKESRTNRIRRDQTNSELKNDSNSLKRKFEEKSHHLSLLGPISNSIRSSFECWLWQKEMKLYQYYFQDENQRKKFTIFEEHLLPPDPPFDLVPTDFDLVAFNNSIFKKMKECYKLDLANEEKLNKEKSSKKESNGKKELNSKKESNKKSNKEDSNNKNSNDKNSNDKNSNDKESNSNEVNKTD